MTEQISEQMAEAGRGISLAYAGGDGEGHVAVGVGVAVSSSRHAPRGGADDSFRVLVLTPSYIGKVSAYAIPPWLSRQPSSTTPAGLADYGEIGRSQCSRRALTTSQQTERWSHDLSG
jgi:hypothetical protein